MNNYLHMTTLSLAMAASGVLAEAPQTGLADLVVADSRTDRPLEGFVWYPTDQQAGFESHHNNPVWQGIEAVKDAPTSAGKRPLVVLSHGMYGNAMNQSWLADALVAEGYVVAAISHPGTSTWLRDPDQARELWERPRDVSRVIDHMLSDPALSEIVDPDRIYMAGHSLGGFTAVALAGGRFDAAKFQAFCGERTDDIACGVISGWQVAETPQDITQMQADLSDDRIKAFAVFDLGGTQSFSAESLSAVDVPMLVIGAPRDIQGLDLDVESRALVATLPKESVTYMEPESLSHFDFLGVCTVEGQMILQEEEPEDAFICQEGREERMAEHGMITSAVVASFQ